MKYQKISVAILILSLSACFNNTKTTEADFTLAFGSCNRQELENTLWSEIEKNKPDVWVWGGDIIYSDTEDMDFLRKNYQIQKNNPAYKHFAQTTKIIGTWDDHDYGLNDGGKEYSKKAESQQLFLDFMGVVKDAPRRKQAGIYFASNYTVDKHSIKIIVLDTRYFRTAITLDPDPADDKRFMPNHDGEGTMLGQAQWRWLADQLYNSSADFNVIMSSIQFLSPTHGFEKWANMSHEVKKMENLIQSSQAKNVIILSGDRHSSEVSKKELAGLAYPLIDFTSSGLTHAYGKEKTEDNPYREGDIIVDKSFGILRFDFDRQQVTMEMRGENNKLLHKYVQIY
ncbi:MAG: alkaline phosphatase family protein [Alcanivoracaceae bacterium]|nr:alkaline phosphatase family protein [Alcanivoracaceae bacterium]